MSNKILLQLIKLGSLFMDLNLFINSPINFRSVILEDFKYQMNIIGKNALFFLNEYNNKSDE